MKRKKTNKNLFVIVIILASLLSLNGLTKIIKENNLFNTSEELSDEVVNASVPNSGYVEKVYFNTNLSNEEISVILSQLTYIEGVDFCAYYVLFTSNKSLFINSINHNEAFQIIYADSTLGSDGIIVLYDTLRKDGWQEFENPIIISDELGNENYDGVFGNENDKIKSLISTNPFN